MRYGRDPEKIVRQLDDDFEAWHLRLIKSLDVYDNPSFIKDNYCMIYRVNKYGEYASVAILLQERNPLVYIDTMDSTVNVCDGDVCTSAVLSWDVWDWTNCCGGE